MHTQAWRLQDAKAQFSQVVEAALRGEPQHVTRRGKAAVVVVSEAEYRTLQAYARAATPGLVAHLMAAPKVDTPADNPQEEASSGLSLREIAF